MSRCIACNKIMDKFDLRATTSEDLSQPEEQYCSKCRHLSEHAEYPSNYVHESDTEQPVEINLD